MKIVEKRKREKSRNFC